MKQKVTTQHTRDRPGSAEARHEHAALITRECCGRKHVGQRRNQPAKQVEDCISDVAQTVLDVVAKDPEKQHVAADVCDAAVHEHRGKERQINRKRCYTKTRDQQALSGYGILKDTSLSNHVVPGDNLQRNGRECVGKMRVSSELL